MAAAFAANALSCWSRRLSAPVFLALSRAREASSSATVGKGRWAASAGAVCGFVPSAALAVWCWSATGSLLVNAAATESGGADSSLASLRTRVDELLAGNVTYQQQLQSATMTLLAELKTELEAGQSEKALPTWDRIQGNISNTSGKLKSTLQQEAGKYKTEVLKLRDWKMFAATEKKQELIKQMQALADSDTQPAQRNKQINSLHKHWQSLGRSRDNESLWKQFKTLSDKAYEPCKA